MTRARLKAIIMFVGVTSAAAAGGQDLQLNSTQNNWIEPTELGGVSGGSFEGVSDNKVELEMLAEARPTVNTHGRDPFQRNGVGEVEKRGGMAQDAPAVDSLGAVVSVGESRDIDDGQLDMIGVVQTGKPGERIESPGLEMRRRDKGKDDSGNKSNLGSLLRPDNL